MNKRNVATVVVAYNPDLLRLREIVHSALEATQRIIIVNNGDDVLAEVPGLVLPGVSIIHNKENVGIAEALNLGIQAAFAEEEISQVLLLDHDSRLSAAAIIELHQVLEELRADGCSRAIAGAYYTNHETGLPAITLRATGLRVVRAPLDLGARYEAVDMVITSGSMLTRDAWDCVGPMDAALFIDLVDLDWCLRARTRGVKVVICSRAGMDHELGKGMRTFFGKPIVRHEPIRNYYFIRNSLWLARRPWTPIAWALNLVWRAAAISVLYPMIMDERRARLRFVLKGLRDGLNGPRRSPSS